MKSRFKTQTLLLFACTAIAVGCTMNVDDPQPNGSACGHAIDDPLFGRRVNPYSLESMKSAYQKVYPSTRSAEIADSLIKPNFVYGRFLPKDPTDVKVLFAEDIELYNYPLDYEILGDPSDYHDPNVPADRITWQYTVLPIDKPRPNVHFEEIEQCFIPTPEMEKAPAYHGVDYGRMERVSYELSDLPSGDNSYTPSYHGNISVADDSLHYVGVKGVKVRARNFLKIRTGHTNSNGDYNISGLSDLHYTPRYELRFENRYGFKIGLGMALILPMSSSLKKEKSINISKTATPKTWAAATINNAAYDWYDECGKLGIPKPPSDLYIWGFESFSGASCMLLHHGTYSFTTLSMSQIIMSICSLNLTAIAAVAIVEGLIAWIGPDVTVCNVNARTSSGIYESTCHELAHASHFRNLGNAAQRAAWWADVIDYEASCIIANLGSDMDPYSAREVAFDDGPCSVTEMWAHAMGNIMKYEKYYAIPDSTDLAKIPVYIGKDRWFKPQILWSLYFAKQLTKKQIYDCLTREVTSLDALKRKLVSNYPDKADTIKYYFKKYPIMLPR